MSYMQTIIEDMQDLGFPTNTNAPQQLTKLFITCADEFNCRSQLAKQIELGNIFAHCLGELYYESPWRTHTIRVMMHYNPDSFMDTEFTSQLFKAYKQCYDAAQTQIVQETSERFTDHTVPIVTETLKLYTKTLASEALSFGDRKDLTETYESIVRNAGMNCIADYFNSKIPPMIKIIGMWRVIEIFLGVDLFSTRIFYSEVVNELNKYLNWDTAHFYVGVKHLRKCVEKYPPEMWCDKTFVEAFISEYQNAINKMCATVLEHTGEPLNVFRN